ncbi:hypothetical protein C4K88_11605 [Arthrobacter pityocampae]|uniref:Uncharacterized protein n=2 Tax=Arthrobacter pityocampae TaxID=547334 RepID=A0A2S5IV33_9MICC|nr:hypothetical protein C4K88_11605 [Arthrobacter pityocampae]
MPSYSVAVENVRGVVAQTRVTLSFLEDPGAAAQRAFDGVEQSLLSVPDVAAAFTEAVDGVLMPDVRSLSFACENVSRTPVSKNPFVEGSSERSGWQKILHSSAH